MIQVKFANSQFNNSFKIDQDSEEVAGIQFNFRTRSEMEEFAMQIQIAHNETYGKGINPEAVQKMKEALEKVNRWFTDANIKFPYKEVKEALKATQL